jgi:5'-3' exonuclease
VTRRRLLLLDTASLYFRAYFGVPTTITNEAGHPVNAVRGLIDFVAKFVRDTAATDVVCCWDNDWRPAWRVSLVPSYKTHRVAGPADVPRDVALPVGAGGRGAQSGVAEIADADLSRQVPWIAAVLDAAGIAMVGADGYEADDVIGTLAATADCPVDVVTSDRDLFQVVRPGVRVVYVAKGISKADYVDDDWLLAKYGITGAQYVDFAVLRGDASDGLPGVAGIGEKTAATLLSAHGSLEGILGAPLSGSVAAKLAAAVDYIGSARQVVGVRTDLPLAQDDYTFPSAPAHPERFAELVDLLNLGSAADRLVAAMRP